MTGDLLTFICKRKHVEAHEEVREKLLRLRPDDTDDLSNERVVRISWEEPTRALAEQADQVVESLGLDPETFELTFYE